MPAIVTVSAILSTVLAIYATVPYVMAILQKKTVPHQFSWFIFVIMDAIILISQLLEGGGASILIAVVFLIGSIIIFLLSLKYGSRGTSRWDRLLLGLALATILVWILTKSNEVAIWLTVIIDMLATSMIILKIRKHPNSEATYPWAIATLAYVFSCISLIDTPIGILYVRPYYGLITDALIVLAILYFAKRTAKARVSTHPK